MYSVFIFENRAFHENSDRNTLENIFGFVILVSKAGATFDVAPASNWSSKWHPLSPRRPLCEQLCFQK